jgi:hypothetical protein
VLAIAILTIAASRSLHLDVAGGLDAWLDGMLLSALRESARGESVVLRSLLDDRIWIPIRTTGVVGPLQRVLAANAI